jgi:hypothetical protein
MTTIGTIGRQENAELGDRPRAANAPAAGRLEA